MEQRILAKHLSTSFGLLTVSLLLAACMNTVHTVHEVQASIWINYNLSEIYSIKC